jgi:hypothetical protein
MTHALATQRQIGLPGAQLGELQVDLRPPLIPLLGSFLLYIGERDTSFLHRLSRGLFRSGGSIHR